MKLQPLNLTLSAALAAMLVACSNQASDQLTGEQNTQQSYDPSSLAAAGNTQHHFQDPNTGQNGISDPAQVRADDQQIGSPEVVARLHSCGKIPFNTLSNILASRGVNTQPAQDGSPTAGTILQSGSAALGVANYAGRVPEAVIASTSAMQKEFDVFVAAAPEIQANLAQSTACPGTTLLDANGKLTKDALSCLMGKPATTQHLTVANELLAQSSDPQTGLQLVISTLLEAAHTCE